MPQIQVAFNGWETQIVLQKVTQSNDDDGNTIQTLTPIRFKGVIQPYAPTALEIKAVGERKWEWYMIHTRFELSKYLEPNDLIFYAGKNYKVMQQNNYQLDGYLEYHLVEDYQNA